MKQIRTKLTKDHEELDALLRRLADDVEAPSVGKLAETWSIFERRLIRHLEVEERFLLPLTEACNPLEAEQTRADHAYIRDSLDELGVAIELHSARKPHIEALIRFLRAHAQHEDEALYQLAGERASSALEFGLIQSLKNAVRLALRPSTRPRAQAQVPRPVQDVRSGPHSA